MKQWNRVIQVNLDNKEFTNNDIDIDFNYPFSSKKEEPDVSTISLFNLSPSTINSIRKGSKITLNAGYEGSVGNIIQGVVEYVDTEYQNVDKETKITISDSGDKWRASTITKTYQAGTYASYIIRDLVNYMGLDIGEISVVKDIKYNRGKSIRGNINNALKVLVKDTKSNMFISKNRMFIRSNKKGTDTKYVINAKSGLITTPTRQVTEETEGEGDKEKKTEKITWKFECNLHHMLDKDHIVKIESKSINGYYKITNGVHKGDFVSELEVMEV